MYRYKLELDFRLGRNRFLRRDGEGEGDRLRGRPELDGASIDSGEA